MAISTERDGAVDADAVAHDDLPEGITSLLDTDLYKLTMQCAVLKYFPDVDVTYSFTNRTKHMKLTRRAFRWLDAQVARLGSISVTPQEIQFLESVCPFLTQPYLTFLRAFRLQPAKHVRVVFQAANTPDHEDDDDDSRGDINFDIRGRWVDTILYEIVLLALTSEAYFRFCDRDWTHEGQEDKAERKGVALLQHGCRFSEFGTRRRRDYHTQDLVLRGLVRAAKKGAEGGQTGRLLGTSNVHFAMKYGLKPVGTVAHEWTMGIAAITDNYEDANETALRYWICTFGTGVLSIALTDTFGTPAFLRAFQKEVPEYTSAEPGMGATLASTAALEKLSSTTARLSETQAPCQAPVEAVSPHQKDGHEQSNGVVRDGESKQKRRTYAETFTGVRQDSGSPAEFIEMMRRFYSSQGIPTTEKVIIFSDSLNIDLCLEYKDEAGKHGFKPSFGIGTFLTNDFDRQSSSSPRGESGNGEKPVKSKPMNIVIKLSSAQGRPAVKISDNIGKNTGDEATVREVKRRLGYVEHDWVVEADGEDGGDRKRRRHLGDESTRLG